MCHTFQVCHRYFLKKVSVNFSYCPKQTIDHKSCSFDFYDKKTQQKIGSKKPCGNAKANFIFLKWLVQNIKHLCRRLLSMVESCIATKIPLMYFQKRICAASVPISIFMCLWAISQNRSTYFPAAEQANQSWAIYKSLTDTWMKDTHIFPKQNLSFHISM